VDVLRTAITEKAEASEEEEPALFEESAKSKTPRRGERRKK
jgi:hypothetical protein